MSKWWRYFTLGLAIGLVIAGLALLAGAIHWVVTG